MPERNRATLTDYHSTTASRKVALSRVIDKQVLSPCDLDDTVILHPFRDGEAVRFNVLMAQARVSASLPDSGPGLPEETRYMALLELACDNMSADDAVLFRFAAGIDDAGIGNVLRKAYGFNVTFLFPDAEAA